MITRREITFEQMKSHCMTIAREMMLDEWKPDLIIGVTRGGALPAVMLSHYFDCKMVGLDVSLRSASKQRVNTHELGNEHNLWAAEEAQNGTNILIVDDINDTGATINWIVNDWECPKGSIRWGGNVRFAVVVDNESSKAVVAPHYCGETINKAVKDEWIDFCFEDFWTK